MHLIKKQMQLSFPILLTLLWISWQVTKKKKKLQKKETKQKTEKRNKDNNNRVQPPMKFKYNISV